MLEHRALALALLAPAAAPRQWQQLPSVGAATSRCHAIPGYESQDVFPTRSPLVVADHLISLVVRDDCVLVRWLYKNVGKCASDLAESATSPRAQCGTDHKGLQSKVAYDGSRDDPEERKDSTGPMESLSDVELPPGLEQ